MNDNSSSLPAKRGEGARIGEPDRPHLGEWRWITLKEGEVLMCATHLASNHVVFSIKEGRGENEVYVRYEEMLKDTRVERDWKNVLQRRIDEKQKELQVAVMLLADKCSSVGLLKQDTAEVETSNLPTLIRTDPEKAKKALTKLKKKTLPEIKSTVEGLTQEMVALHSSMFLPEKAQMRKMKKACDTIDERLFALELYSGMWDKVKQIKEGTPASEETPISIRQLLLFMDEETLFNYDGGGMDFKSVKAFDEWVTSPENFTRMLPEPKGIVVFRVRRHEKDYGAPLSISAAFDQWEKHQMNKLTYLLIRNGENVYRLLTEVDFSPRLIPFRDEFNKPFTDSTSEFNWEKRMSFTKTRVVTPEDLDYDEKAENRASEIRHYNRTIFLVQGLLDRSKVFSPHPLIDLTKPDMVERYVQLIRDEEDALPSGTTVSWESYRDSLNKKVRVGNTIWHNHEEEYWDAYSKQHRSHITAPQIAVVSAIKRDKSQVQISWPWGKRWGYEKSDGRGGYYGSWGEWEVNRKKHQWIPMTELINMSAYQPGDFKQFLCDRTLKGKYLEWAPFLLNAEKWHKNGKKIKEGE